MSDSGMKWYVLRTVSGQEHKTATYIEKEMAHAGMSDLVGRVLIPMEKVVQVRNGKKVIKEKTKTPGYMYVEATLTGEVGHMIKNLPNVIGFLANIKGGDPSPMRAAEVARLLGQVDQEAENAAMLMIPFTVGETVKVINGPFSTFDATIEKINEEKQKLEVTVKIFGRKTPVELGFTEVEKL
tara:strand:- start:1687 stop:2235 length:549 start_codon:yes stop_codon:yes gene_type:complete